MHRISVRGTVLAFPSMCCCCGDPKAKKRYQALGSYVGRWVNTKYREKRWWNIPICKRCDQWTRATHAAASWFPLFVGSLAIGALSVIPAALEGFQPVAGVVFGVIALCTLGVSSVAFPLWQIRRAQSRQLNPGPPCNPYPVVLLEWLRDKHTFGFSNEGYFQRFAALNRDRIS
jgi:hypothetical protein